MKNKIPPPIVTLFFGLCIYFSQEYFPESNVEFGSGKGGLVSPSETSAELSKQGTLGTYISGRSYKGSDGKA